MSIKKVTIQKYGVKTTENNFEVEDWLDWKTLWLLNANNLYGKEYWEAKALQSEDTVNFVVRYSKILKDLNSKEYRIIFNDKIYDIEFVDNILYKNEKLKIRARCIS